MSGKPVNRRVQFTKNALREAMIEVGKEGIDGLGGYFVLGDDRNVEREFFFTRWNGKSGDEAAFEKID